MERLVLISKGKETLNNLCMQIRELIGDEIKVEGYCLDEITKEKISNAFIVITSYLMKEQIISTVGNKIDYIIAKRVINYHYLNKLIELPYNTEVLLVNDHIETCYSTIENLKHLGINHVKYYPYYPGIDRYKKLEIAVTPGESYYAPHCVKKIIDIGPREIDITTIVEILVHFKQINKRGENLSSYYVKKIVNLLKQYNQEVNVTLELKNMFQAIVNNSNDGIIYLDTSGKIKDVNNAFKTIMKNNNNIVNKKIDDIIPQLKGFRDEEIERDIFNINGNNLVIDKIPVRRKDKTVGYMITIENAMKIREIEHKIRRKIIKEKGTATYTFGDIVCKSNTMKRTIELAKKLATSNSTILIQGESGTGKELFAQALHNYSNRKDNQFIPVNFAALPNSLVESELFGYEEGSFTGAKKGGKEGLFEESHGGTIFLDEIGDASLEIQARLLRVLQEKQVRRIGSSKLIPLDSKVIAATNKNLKLLVEEGKFRNDLFYRLNVFPIYIPPLRERREDILLLIEMYLHKFTKSSRIGLCDFFSKDTLEFLEFYDWPGNIRELVNVLEYLVNVKERGNLIEISDLPGYVTFKSSNKDEHINNTKESIIYDNKYLILKVLTQNKYAGRRMITKKVRNQNNMLTESRVRRLLKDMESEGLIINYKTKGNSISDKGRKVFLKYTKNIIN